MTGEKLNTSSIDGSMNYLLRRASQRFKEVAVPVLKQHGLSTIELITMHLIQSNKGSILRTLADSVGVEPPAMNRIINSLEEKMLATRHKSKDDARYTYFALTEDGLDRLNNANKQFIDSESKVMKSMTECERNSLRLLLQGFI